MMNRLEFLLIGTLSIFLLFTSCLSDPIKSSLNQLLKCQLSVRTRMFSCISNDMIVACSTNLFNSQELKQSDIFGVGFFMSSSSKSKFSKQTKFPMYALSANLVDFKNYSTPHFEYTIHHHIPKTAITDHGIQITDLDCFRNLWTIFKQFAHRKVISLETDVKGFLPTATIFGQIKLI